MKRFISIGFITILLFSLLVLDSTKAQETKFNMTYLYNGTVSEQLSFVDRTNGGLDVVAPNYFDINSDGELKITDHFSEDFIHDMHERNIKVVPYLSNHWNLEPARKMLAKKEAFAEELVKVVKQYDLDGLNIDIEGLTEQDRKDLTEFVRIVSEMLPKDKELAVAVAANTKGLEIGWHGSYDYQALAKYADYLMIMAYDESWNGSDPGPVASIDFVEKSIQYALNQMVPNDKIVLGVPFYGRIWRTEDVKEIEPNASFIVKGRGIPAHRISSLVDTYDGSFEFVEKFNSVKATFTINEGDPETKLYEWLPPFPKGEYVIWYENEVSLKAKMDLVQQYDLKGTGSWSLGQENPDIWKNYRLWLNGQAFKDVPVTFWAHDVINTVNQRDWMNGRSTYTFAPDESLKRSEAAAVLVRILGLDYQEDHDSPFIDVSEDYWASETIEIVRQHGLLNGRSENEFAPEANVTRGEMAVILDRLLEGESLPIGEPKQYTDVNEELWSYHSIMYMSRAEMFSGFKDGSFRPEDNVTRAQMAALLNRISPYVEAQ